MRSSVRVCVVLAGVVALACGAVACSTSKSSSIVALGDSVPRGTNCDCTPYPTLSGEDLTANTGRSVTVTNDAVAGATSADVLGQVNSDRALSGHLRTADAVEIEVGANDVGYAKSCGTAVDCYARHLPSLEGNLAAIVTRTRELTSGHKLIVVLLDYWSVWLGGQYAAAQGPAYVNAADELTDRVDAIIKATAAQSGSYYVDLRTAFRGPDRSYDETHYLSSDGDHPNASGHQQIAKAVDSVLAKALR